MFPHIPLQAITLDLADTRSISQTVEHILNNAIFIPETDNDNTSQPLIPTTNTTHTSISSSQSHVPLTDRGESGSELRRRHGFRTAVMATDHKDVDLIRDNQSGSVSCDEEGHQVIEEEEEEDPMTFSSLQRRKRELVNNARK